MNDSAAIIVERIDALLEIRNEKRQTLTDAVGIVSNSLTSWSKRGTYPAADVFYAIATYLGVTVEYLLTGTDTRYGATPERIRAIITDLERLEGRDLMHVAALVHTIADAAEHNAIRLSELIEQEKEQNARAGRVAGDVVSLGMHEKDRLTGVKKTPGASEESAG